jgi:uncharacterized protein (DUF1501 family)
MSNCNCPHDDSLAHMAHRLKRKGVTRREILGYTLAGAGLTALGPWVGKIPLATGAPQGKKIYVVIDLDGGCDTLNMVVPTALPSYFSRRPTIQVAGSLPLVGSPASMGLGLHPSFPNLLSMWNQGDVAIVQRVGYPTANQSHFESQDIYSYGIRGPTWPAGVPTSGWMARFADLYTPTPMGAVALGMGRPTSFVGGSSNPLQVSSLGGFKFNSDSGSTGIVNNDTYRKNTIKSILASASTVGTPGGVRSALDQAHTLSAQIQTAVSSFVPVGAYAANKQLAQRLKDVAILIQGGFETQLFLTGTGGFDTHSAQGNQAGYQAGLFTDIDNALAAFRADMVAMGQWNNTVICLYTEFGRRTYENGSAGTDHGGPFTMVLLGGAVNGGAGNGPTLQDSDLAVGTEFPTYGIDFRDIHREVLNDHLGVNPAPVFPEPQPLNGNAAVI